MTKEPSKFNLFTNDYQPKKIEASKDGYLMLEDLVVASYLDGNFSIIDASLCPFYILRTNDFQDWVSSRSIDTHRTNSRILRKSIRLKSSDEFNIVMNNYCVTITDRYWFKPFKSNLCYKDVKFNSDKLSLIALDGKFVDMSTLNISSPEFTNTGSFEKCWKLINNEWFLVKKANPFERFSELLIYRLGNHLKLDMAEYLLLDGRDDVIMSKDFTNGGNVTLEPMWSLIDDNDSYVDNIQLIKNIDKAIINCDIKDLINQYLDIIFMDTICMNIDRHTKNYGFIRNNKTGNILRLAPNFDNNLALISRGINTEIKYSPRSLLYEFREVMIDNSYNIPNLDREELSNIVNQCAYDCKLIDDSVTTYVTDFIWTNYCLIRSELICHLKR
ncbi:HipA domain-containing protein [uncultured Clostridium sp.]|uniref:HipA domain-containing protein n=1 Tax=uncultured Clostridium sp. TaxID=59620 RepID=UPI0026F39CF8|nr:HipA domain-containing protein [uncultured Clostridium sp.]